MEYEKDFCMNIVLFHGWPKNDSLRANKDFLLCDRYSKCMINC